MRSIWWCVLAALAPTALAAQAPEGRTEISIYVGASLLDAKVETSAPVPLPQGPSVRPSVPVPGDIEFRASTSLGASFLQGFRVARYLNERVAVDLAFSVAPTHDLRIRSSFFCRPEKICPLFEGHGPRPIADIGPTIPIFELRENVTAYDYSVNLAYDLARGEVRPFLSFGVGGVSYDVPGEVRTDFAINLAGGAKLYFGKLGARLEVADHVVPDHFLTGKAEHDVQVRGGLLFRLP